MIQRATGHRWVSIYDEPRSRALAQKWSGRVLLIPIFCPISSASLGVDSDGAASRVKGAARAGGVRGRDKDKDRAWWSARRSSARLGKEKDCRFIRAARLRARQLDRNSAQIVSRPFACFCNKWRRHLLLPQLPFSSGNCWSRAALSQEKAGENSMELTNSKKSWSPPSALVDVVAIFFARRRPHK